MVSESATIRELIDEYLRRGPYAVVGASTDRDKYGNKVLRAYKQRDFTVYPINPQAREVEGLKAYPDLASLPERVYGISVITPPHITEKIVDAAASAGVRCVWMQPGAESAEAVRKAQGHGMSVIADGSCFLVVTGFKENG